MGKYDDISPERLRADLVAFAELILRLDRDEELLSTAAELQRMLGDLRQKLFAYEVRSSRLPRHPQEDPPDREDDPVLRASRKVVREAHRRREEMLREWDGHSPEEDEDDE